MTEKEIAVSKPLIELHFRHVEKIELPCRDMDTDCLPDSDGTVPFGNYAHCHAFDPEQGTCPFLPI